MQPGHKVRIRLTWVQRRFLIAILKNDYIEVIGFGGARGGGKTFISCLAMVLRRIQFPGSKGLMLRQTQGAADQNIGEEIEKVLKMLGIPIGPKSVHWSVSEKQWQFPNGSYIQLGYCKNEKDWQRWQGQQFMDLCFEEATQFPERVYLDIIASNRNGDNHGAGGKIWITCNPGGVGTTWVKTRFIDPKTRDAKTVWIKATLRDNMALLENDPGYRDRTLAKQPEWRRKQWEEGDWDSVEGKYWSINPSMVREMEVPYWADLYAGVDAGYFPSAFATIWVAKWKDLDGRIRIHVWREFKKQRLSTTAQAHEALEIERIFDRETKARFADPKAWSRSGNTDEGVNIVTAYQWCQAGFIVSAAYSNARVAGWLLLRTLIENHIMTIDPSCMALLKEFDEALHDDKSDDMLEPCEDHLLDALRYCLVSILANVAPGELKDPYEKREARREKIERKVIMLQRRDD